MLVANVRWSDRSIGQACLRSDRNFTDGGEIFIGGVGGGGERMAIVIRNRILAFCELELSC